MIDAARHAHLAGDDAAYTVITSQLAQHPEFRNAIEQLQSGKPVDMGAQTPAPGIAEQAIRAGAGDITGAIGAAGDAVRGVAGSAMRLGAEGINALANPVGSPLPNPIDPNAAAAPVERALTIPYYNGPTAASNNAVRGLPAAAAGAVQSATPGAVQQFETAHPIPQPISDTVNVLGAASGGENAIPGVGAAPASLVARTGGDVAEAAGYTGLRSRADLAKPGSQAVTDALISQDAGLPKGVAPNVKAVQDARKAGPGKIYNAAQAAVPPSLTHDAQLQSDIAGIQTNTSQFPNSPDVGALKQTMLDQPNMTSQQLFANIEQAHDRASRYYASDQPDHQDLGDAYSSLANAYENFAGRQIKDPTLLDQFQQARVQFAKNYLAEAALKGGEHFDPAVYGRRAANPKTNDLTGNGAIVGQTYNTLPGAAAAGRSPVEALGGVLGAGAGAGIGHLFGEPLMGGAGGLAVGAAGAHAARGALSSMATRGNLDAAAAAPTNPALSYFHQPDYAFPSAPQPPEPSQGSLPLGTPLHLQPAPGAVGGAGPIPHGGAPVVGPQGELHGMNTTGLTMSPGQIGPTPSTQPTQQYALALRDQHQLAAPPGVIGQGQPPAAHTQQPDYVGPLFDLKPPRGRVAPAISKKGLPKSNKLGDQFQGGDNMDF
jgi:hypothetical protein